MQETQETQVGSVGREDPREEEIVFPTPVFSLKKSCGQRSLAGYNP